MPSPASILSLATAVTGASAAIQGFNYDAKGRDQAKFEAEFKNAKGLEGTNGAFTSARLYTMIQDGSQTDPISAIPAAISTKTNLLFGLWASAGQDAFNRELAALKNTIDQYCGQLDGLVDGISLGSEDLYRETPIGRAYGEDPGASPETLSKYLDELRKTVKGSCLEKVPIGHVDTWTAYANETNRFFFDKLDWVGMDAYPYFENTKDNDIENAKELFQAAIDNTNAGTGGKPLWVTETGWPTSGKTQNKAVANVENAQTFWREVGCPMFGKTNVYWYTMQDGNAGSTDVPSFGVIGAELTTKPLYDLSCDGYTDGGSGSKSSSTSAATSSHAQTSSGAQSTGTSGPSSASTDAPATGSETSAPTSTPVGPVGPVGPIGTGTGVWTSRPVATPSGGNNGGSNPSASNTPAPIGNSAAGLNSVGAAVAALVMAVAAF